MSDMPRPQEINIWFSLPAPFLWQIEAPVLDIPLSQLAHNLDICYREKEGTDDRNLTPRACLTNSEKEVSHFQLIDQADTNFPIILYAYQDQRIILDGVHRFAKARKEKQASISAKCLTFKEIAPFLSKEKYPFLLLQKAPFPFSKKEMKADFSSSFLDSLEKLPYFPARCYKNFFLKHTHRLNETELQTANQLHKRESDFFSASYSGDWLLLGMSKEKIGVDLELIKPRDESLLKTYEKELKTHFWRADRNTFYLLRTAKEAILKASDTNNLDRLAEIELLSAEKKTQMIKNLPFTWAIHCSFQGENRLVYSHENKELAWSLCTKNEQNE